MRDDFTLNRDVQNISISLVNKCRSFINNDNCNNNDNYNNDATLENDAIISSFNNTTSSSLFPRHSVKVNDTSIELSFRERLASCFVDNNLTHIQGNNILSLLRTHPCFSTLPKDIRTFLDTPNTRVVVSDVEAGEYVHFDLEAGIVQHLSNISIPSIINYLELDFNVDGCSLDKSDSNQIWLIQCRIVNIQ